MGCTSISKNTVTQHKRLHLAISTNASTLRSSTNWAPTKSSPISMPPEVATTRKILPVMTPSPISAPADVANTRKIMPVMTPSPTSVPMEIATTRKILAVTMPSPISVLTEVATAQKILPVTTQKNLPVTTIENAENTCVYFDNYCCISAALKHISCTPPPRLSSFPTSVPPNTSLLVTSGYLGDNCPLSWNAPAFKKFYPKLHYLKFDYRVCQASSRCMEKPDVPWEVTFRGICIRRCKNLFIGQKFDSVTIF